MIAGGQLQTQQPAGQTPAGQNVVRKGFGPGFEVLHRQYSIGQIDVNTAIIGQSNSILRQIPVCHTESMSHRNRVRQLRHQRNRF